MTGDWLLAGQIRARRGPGWSPMGVARDGLAGKSPSPTPIFGHGEYTIAQA